MRIENLVFFFAFTCKYFCVSWDAWNEFVLFGFVLKGQIWE